MSDLRAVRRSTRLRVALGGAAIFGLVSTGSTYAAFSDVDTVTGNEAAAGRVTIGLPGVETGPELRYAGLVPTQSQSDSIRIAYYGTTPADLALELRPDGASSFCERADDGSWHPKPGGALQISVGAGWLDYCSLLDNGSHLPVRDAVAPGSEVSVDVVLRLAPGTDYSYSELSDVDRLTVTAQQTGLDGGGFTDFAVGTITIGTGFISPPVPAECAELGPFDQGHTIVLTDGDDTFATPVTPEGGRGYVVFALGGQDRVSASNHADCLVGGDGDDVLSGGNQHDVLVGGAGDDQLVGSDQANGKDLLFGGPGSDELHGENGQDALSGGDGDDVLYGGTGTDLWDPGAGTDRCIDPSTDPATFDPADYGGCESVAVDETAAPLTAALPTTSEPSPEELVAPADDGAEPTEPTEPTEPIEPTEPTEPVAESTDPEPETTEPPATDAEPAEDATEPTEPTEAP